MTTKAIAVLLIEDMNSDADAIHYAVSKMKIKNVYFKRVSRLQEGLSALAESKYDIVLLDLSLPDARGINAVIELNNKFPQVPIIIVSDQSDENIIKRALSSGAKKFLIKSECSGLIIEHNIRELTKEIEEFA
jgi:DNA-binding NarL/FixJ family response regulator